MATMLPPIKGQAFSFEVGLVSQADTDIFQTNVTIGTADVWVSGNGGTAVNIVAAPTEIVTAAAAKTGMLSVALGTAETNYDRVSVLFHDAAGSEWQDALVTIYTTARHLDDLAYPTTTGRSIDVATTGEVGLDFTNILPASAPTTLTNITVPTVTTVSGNVGGSVTGSVASVANLGTAAIDTALSATHGAGAWGGTAVVTSTVAISAAQASSVVSGSLALRTHHTWSQAITSTSTADLGSATKVWLAVKSNKNDADSASIFMVEESAGLLYLAAATAGTAAHGTITVTGSSGAWVLTGKLEEAATGALTSYIKTGLPAECKALVAGDTVAVWDGDCDILRGIVQVYA